MELNTFHFIVGTDTHVGLKSDFLDVRESMASVNICTILKNPIKRSITLYFMMSGGTAEGKKLCVCA